MSTDKKIFKSTKTTSKPVIKKELVATGFKARVNESERKSRGKAQKISVLGLGMMSFNSSYS